MKNKIHNYDFLIIGAGLIGSLTALYLQKKKFKVLVIDKNKNQISDNRTLAINANSRDFLKNLGIWTQIKNQPQEIKKILIKDNTNSKDLVFENNKESMGSVAYNKEILSIARNTLLKKKSLITGLEIPISKLCSEENLNINQKAYSFKKIILTIGKTFEENYFLERKNFNNRHQSFVGFFDHSHDHRNIAYEIFTADGPFAVLPAPKKNKNFSTFIFSTKNNMTYLEIKRLLRHYFSKSHGNIILKKKIQNFKISPHLSKTSNPKILLLGDTLRSIHPVAGQGWNLGVKDIEHLGYCLDLYDLESKDFNNFYFSNRHIEGSNFLGFTSLINYLYDNQNSLNRSLIKLGFYSLNKISFLRDAFIQKAMGR